MPQPPSLLMLQFLAWVADRPRLHADVMEAWRSHCPRNSVWEDAVIAGLVRLDGAGSKAVVLTPLGRATLEQGPPSDPGRPDTLRAQAPLASNS